MAEKKSYRVANIYEVEGDTLKRKTKLCPKCKNGTFMAKHKDRYHCGKCGYTEFLNS